MKELWLFGKYIGTYSDRDSGLDGKDVLSIHCYDFEPGKRINLLESCGGLDVNFTTGMMQGWNDGDEAGGPVRILDVVAAAPDHNQ